MARRKAKATRTRAARSRKQAAPKRSASRASRASASTKRRPAKRAAKPSRKTAAKTAAPKRKAIAPKSKRVARRRRKATEEVVPTPPSSLNMNRHGSAARSGRAELAAQRLRRRNLSPELAGGDQDADLESAYFTGDETAGGDNPTPDQDLVDDIGRAVGVEYQDNEELGTTDKVTERDRHRWELDPASAEDYKDRT